MSNKKQLLEIARRRQGRPSSTFGIPRNEAKISQARITLNKLLHDIEYKSQDEKEARNIWREATQVVDQIKIHGGVAEDLTGVYPGIRGQREGHKLRLKGLNNLILNAENRIIKIEKKKLQDQIAEQRMEVGDLMQQHIDSLKKNTNISDEKIKEMEERKEFLDKKFIYQKTKMEEREREESETKQMRIEEEKVKTPLRNIELKLPSRPDTDLDYKHGYGLPVETNNRSSSNPEMEDSLIPSTFVGRSDFKNDVAVNETSESNKNNFSTSNTAIPSYALTEEKMERFMPAQFGGQTNTRNNENVYDYTLEVKGGGSGTNDRSSSLNAPDIGLPNTGNFGLPQPGKGGRYIFADLNELNNNEIDIRGTAISDMWGSRVYEEEVKLHNRGGGNIAGGAGDVMDDDSKDFSNTDAWGGLFFGHDELEDELDPVLSASSLENSNTLDMARRLFSSDEQGYENNRESKRNAFDMFTSSIDDEWKSDILDRSINRMLGDEYGTSAVDSIKQKRRIKMALKGGILSGRKLPFRTTAPTLKDIPYRPPSSTYRTNQVGLVRESATNNLRSVNELLPRV